MFKNKFIYIRNQIKHARCEPGEESDSEDRVVFARITMRNGEPRCRYKDLASIKYIRKKVIEEGVGEEKGVVKIRVRRFYQIGQVFKGLIAGTGDYWNIVEDLYVTVDGSMLFNQKTNRYLLIYIIIKSSLDLIFR